MATLVAYTGDEPVSLSEVKTQCHIDHDVEDTFISGVIIPGARALAEGRTGSAVRKGTFTEAILVGQSLSVGQVISVESVKIDGVDVAFSTSENGGRTVIASSGNDGKTAVVAFTAGTDITQFPGVKSWILLTCGWMYEHREGLSLDGSFSEMPKRYIDTLLVPIELPNPF